MIPSHRHKQLESKDKSLLLEFDFYDGQLVADLTEIQLVVYFQNAISVSQRKSIKENTKVSCVKAVVI